MREIHEGICGNHAGGQALAHKVLRQGYYWPTMKKNAAGFVRRCDKCQRFSSYTNSHPETLNSMFNPWCFAVWGIDIIGALPVGKGGVTTSPSGLKQSPWQQSPPRKYKALYGGSSFVDMESRKSWSQIMESNLIATSSKTYVMS